MMAIRINFDYDVIFFEGANIKIRTLGDVVIFEILAGEEKEINFKQLRQKVIEYQKNKYRMLIVDLSQLKYIGRRTVRELMKETMFVFGKNKLLKLVCPQNKIQIQSQEIINYFKDAFDMFDDLNQAIISFRN